MENRFELALKIALEAHAGQVDKNGEAYILHPLAVMANLTHPVTLSEKIVAILHDVIEDSHFQLKDLTFLTKEEKVSIDCLTKRKGQTYEFYLLLIAQNAIARKVKLADLKHNMDITRLCAKTQKDWTRIQKYTEAYCYLTNY